MPYLSDKDRKHGLIAGTILPDCAGDINFIIADTVDVFLTHKGMSYASLNEAIGAIECAKLEVYRRLAAPYEDIKIAENGDVFTVVPGRWSGGATAAP